MSISHIGYFGIRYILNQRILPPQQHIDHRYFSSILGSMFGILLAQYQSHHRLMGFVCISFQSQNNIQMNILHKFHFRTDCSRDQSSRQHSLRTHD